MDWSPNITIAVSAITLVLGMLGMFIWVTVEASLDRRHAEIQAENRRVEMNALLKAIHDEMKDFHGRLCAIEERRIRILEK